MLGLMKKYFLKQKIFPQFDTEITKIRKSDIIDL